MEYLLIVFDDPAELDKMTDAETATTVRVRGGKRLVSDGPCAETNEHLVGYYLIAANDLDEAIAIAERVPSARFGAVEVRPVRRHS
jgi:hypothetical protein